MDHVLQSNFSLMGEIKVIKTCSRTGRILSETPWMKNQIMANDARGIYMMLDRLTNDTTYTGIIKYAEIGDDNTAPTSADTDMGNGLVRVQVGSYSRSALTATFRFFFPDATTPDDTYLEFGMFVDGSITLGTGRLFNRILFATDLIKSTGEDHTVVCRVTGSV